MKRKPLEIRAKRFRKLPAFTREELSILLSVCRLNIHTASGVWDALPPIGETVLKVQVVTQVVNKLFPKMLSSQLYYIKHKRKTVKNYDDALAFLVEEKMRSSNN